MNEITLDNASLELSNAMRNIATATKAAIRDLAELAVVIREHEEEWRCSLPGQWPDRFALLNRYVRTRIPAPYIFND